VSEYDKDAAAERLKARTKELTDKLETGIKELYNSDKYKEYLKYMSKFHSYSSKNIMLIHLQKPGATRIASFKHWKDKFNRNVNKGEQGLYIYAPIGEKKPEKVLMEKLDPETGTPLLDDKGQAIMEEMTSLTNGPRFKLVPVFDVSQTSGDPLPELAENLIGNVEHYEAFVDTLKAVSRLPVDFEPLPDNFDGYCRFGEKIGIREGMSEVQSVVAMIHEITHERLHDKNNTIADDKPKSKQQKEIEAESVAYVVCQRFGIETSANSFGYLAEWGSRDLSEFKASLDTIRKESSSLISAIEDRLSVICKERGIDLTEKAPEQSAPVPEKAPEPAYTTETRIENIAGLDFTYEKVKPISTEKTNINTVESDIYQMFAALFPQVEKGEYSYLRLDAGEGFMPLSIEWISENQVSIMHTYTQNGDLMYDPMMVIEVDREAQTAAAVQYEQSNPPLYQRIDENGIGHSIDGNGNEQELSNLQMALNGFMRQWLVNISEQGYMPEIANMVLYDEDVRITFDKDGNPIMPVPETPDIIMPDPSISFSERDLYGYTAIDMLPLTVERAVELFDSDHTIYMLNSDNTEDMAFDRDEIITFSSNGLLGITKADWLMSPEYTAQIAAEKSESAKESEFLHGFGDANAFAIYQVKSGDETRDFRFEGLESLEQKGFSIDRSNYELVYAAPFPEKIEHLTDRTSVLNSIYQDFNIEHPEDYTGRSVSVSDIIMLRLNDGEFSAHFVDTIGFNEIVAFLGNERQTEHEQTLVEATAVPTVAELEAQVKDGQSISLLDLAHVVKNERHTPEKEQKTDPANKTQNSPSLSAIPASEPKAVQKKPSLLADLEAGERRSKEQFGQKSDSGKETPKRETRE